MDRSAGQPWIDAVAQVLVADLDEPELDPDALHHLARVLRVRVGETICVTDGAGGWRHCSFTGSPSTAGSSGLDPLHEVRSEPAPTSRLTVGFSLVKGDRPELVVQKLTELGVDRIVPLATERSVVRWEPARAQKNLQRLRRVAVEACAQCRRLWLPQVGWSEDADDPTAPARVATLGDLAGAGAVAADVGGRPLTDADRTVLIGPEGGWSESEVASLERVSLGVNVLRAETAAITAGALMTALRAGLTESVHVGTSSHGVVRDVDAE